MRTKRDIVLGIANIAIDAICVICGAYMVCELHRDIDNFKRG